MSLAQADPADDVEAALKLEGDPEAAGRFMPGLSLTAPPALSGLISSNSSKDMLASSHLGRHTKHAVTECWLGSGLLSKHSVCWNAINC